MRKLYAVKKNGQAEGKRKREWAAGPKKAIKKSFPESCPVRCVKTASWTYHVICHCVWTGGPKEYFYKEENSDTQIEKV